MKTRHLKTVLARISMVAVAFAATGHSLAATVDVYLAAREHTKSLPGAVSVPMWGFAECDSTYTDCGAGPDSPGPVLAAISGDTLVIHLRNDLAVPVSLVITGQAGDGSPVWDAGRVRSFTMETDPGLTEVYTWDNLRAGTFLYQSGTQPSVQVAMGLYGALVVADAGYPGVFLDLDRLVVYSEIDKVQNDAVAAAVAADSANPAYPATVDYSPQYFLVNGAAYDPSSPPSPLDGGDGTVDRTLLLRLVNAGLLSHAPSIVGLDVTVRAEDGNLYPTPRTHSSIPLPAGKTLDATVALPAGDRTYPIFDRMLDLSNDNQPEGGLLAYLQTGAGSTTGGGPVLGDDTYSVVEDNPLIVNSAAGVLANDGGATGAQVVAGPTHGALSLGTDGSFTYTPDLDFSGQDSFTYTASTLSGPGGATVTLNVSFANDGPVSGPDGPYTNSVGTTISLAAPGVLGNDRDVDGDDLTALLAAPVVGLTLDPDGSFTYTGVTDATFTYRASDGIALSAPVTVTLDVRMPNAPLLSVLGPGNPPQNITEYRWVLEEDTTYRPDPATVPNPQEKTLALNFHKSYMPVVAQGCVGAACETQVPFTDAVIDPLKHYFVSVLPLDAGTDTGHTLGGAPVPPGATSVTVNVYQAPVPQAQISVLVFRDDNPTNGAPDGGEPGLGGFQIQLEDGAGRYGQAAGQMMQDAFGNPLKNWLDCGPGAPPAPENVILTCPDGSALIKNLPPGKYGVSAVPPSGNTEQWVQTSTIEGKKVIDAWVKAAEPDFFQEFGPPAVHAFIGFVSPVIVHQGTPDVPHPVPIGPNQVTGRITNVHMSRPPDQRLYNSGSRDALAHTVAWVGLNSAAGVGPTIAVARADADGYFQLPSPELLADYPGAGIPDGSYQLVVWDEFLDQIIAFQNVTVSGGGGGDMGDVAVFQWFHRVESNVFMDMNENGILDAGEEGIPEQAVNIRFRDGTIFQSFPTDTVGFVPFDEMFPFFNWMVAEVDFARYKATGMTAVVDHGGDVSGGDYPGLLNPQQQTPADGGGFSRTETGPVLLEAFQGFIGQTTLIDWGKKPYAHGENGGISGIVYYATTRAEDDPRLAAADMWEPGIPRATVRLYREVTRQDGSTGLVFVDEVQSDSWDDSVPTGCPGADPIDPVTPLTKCYDGYRNFNQMRPGVFDGGYAFTDIPAGRYVVEVVPPPGYDLVKEEDKNVVFGDVYATAPAVMMMAGGAMIEVLPDAATVLAAQAPEPGLAQPPCVGPDHPVPDYLSLFPGQMLEAPFAGALRPLCNRKEVILNDQANAVADFYLFTQAPIATHGTGMIQDDTAQEINPTSPQFGEKWAPPFVPVSVRDWNGLEINRVYSDQWGRFNLLSYSTYSGNLPMFSGVSPAMHIACMNDPGPIQTAGGLERDPLYNPRYGTFCYTLQYMPGTTTYLDTPVLPTSAFAAGDNPVDCSFREEIPKIRQVDGTGIGPYVDPALGNTVTILAQGPEEVQNPAYAGPTGGEPLLITRHYGFGAVPGTVTLDTTPLNITSWADDQIVATLPAGAASGQLIVTRGDNLRTSVNSITLTVGGTAPVRVHAGESIQAAIDAAAPGSLVIVEPGTYEEMLVMWKPLQLQGSGAGSTFIVADPRPPEKLVAWRDKVALLVADGTVDLLPGQTLDPTIDGEEGAGVTVLALNLPGNDNSPFNFQKGNPARIDGFSITGGNTGGAILVNGYAHRTRISNNDIYGNSGIIHGGIRVGAPFLPLADAGPFGFNTQISIHHNAIKQNGAVEVAGGGIALFTGTDSYSVDHNWICGNFTQGDGAGIDHFGLSHQGQITNNQILFNQNFNQALNVHGGGIFIGGEPSAVGGLTPGSGRVLIDSNLIQGNHAAAGMGGGIRTQLVSGLDVQDSPGQRGQWWQIKITNNMITNNVAGWAGGGISLMDTPNAEIWNNTLAHNDSTSTVGNTFTTGPNVSDWQIAGLVSQAHSALLAATFNRNNNTRDYRVFSNPVLNNNIFWENRSFHYEVVGEPGSGIGTLIPDLAPASQGDCVSAPNLYRDLGILEVTGDPSTDLQCPQPGNPPTMATCQMDPEYSILTYQAAPDAALPFNRPGPPAFLAEYCNGSRSTQILQAQGGLVVAPALDEGGNFIDVRYGPISQTRADNTVFGDHHIGPSSTAYENALCSGAPVLDYDGQTRTCGTSTTGFDIGADEISFQGTVSFTSATLGTLSGTTTPTLAFGNLSGPQASTVTLTNTGGASVTYGVATVTNGTGSAFSKGADACSGTTVAAGGTCTITINFNAPNNNSSRTGTLSVPSVAPNTATNNPATLDLTGS